MKKLTPAAIDEEVLKKLQEKAPDIQQKTWEYTAGYARRFKDALTEHLVIDQSKRCAYCGLRLRGKRHHRDHIAPKESHPEFTFVPANLVLACYCCNTDFKGTYDPITTKNASYEKCDFRIVHPYFDDPDQHITFVGGPNEILIQVNLGSVKGTETVRLFRLDSVEAAKQRAKDAMLDSDLEFLGSGWAEGFEVILNSNIKMKPQTSP